MKDLRVTPTILAAQVIFATVLGVSVAHQVLLATFTLDFAQLWAAPHTPHPYDPKTISAVLGQPGRCCFPYAPPFLLLITPFRVMSLDMAFVSWVCVSAAAISTSLRRLAGPVVLLVPAVFLAGGIGQTSLSMAALLYLGASIPKRPLVAGMLFGLAAVIKPQALILLPIVLIVARQWWMILAACATAGALSLAATITFGGNIWVEWLASLPGFIAANDAAWSARYLSLPGSLKVVPLVIGAIGCGLAARSRRFEQAVFIAVAATLLGSPHAMDYDEAILAPFAIAAALEARWRGIPFWIAAFLPPSRYTVTALALMACTANSPIWRQGTLRETVATLLNLIRIGGKSPASNDRSRVAVRSPDDSRSA